MVMDAAFVFAIGFFQHVVDFRIGESLAQVFHDVAEVVRHDPALAQFIKHPVRSQSLVTNEPPFEIHAFRRAGDASATAITPQSAQ